MARAMRSSTPTWDGWAGPAGSASADGAAVGSPSLAELAAEASRMSVGDGGIGRSVGSTKPLVMLRIAEKGTNKPV